MKICVKSVDIDLHTLSMLKQHTRFYSGVLDERCVLSMEDKR